MAWALEDYDRILKLRERQKDFDRIMKENLQAEEEGGRGKAKDLGSRPGGSSC